MEYLINFGIDFFWISASLLNGTWEHFGHLFRSQFVENRSKTVLEICLSTLNVELRCGDSAGRKKGTIFSDGCP